MSLGMTLDQLVRPDKYGRGQELWESQSPPGERLAEYVKRELNTEPHEGRTPPQDHRQVLDYSKRAVDEIGGGSAARDKNRDEFERPAGTTCTASAR
jgi:hypothetical protein